MKTPKGPSANLVSIRKGNFKEALNLNVDCYVLNDSRRTAVISKRGMGLAIGLSKPGGGGLTRFVKRKGVSQHISQDLIHKLENPIIFKAPGVGSAMPSVLTHGYDVTILIDICNSIIKANEEGSLLSVQKHLADRAQVILSASAKSGITGLVYAISGYDATREEVINNFREFVREEARVYEKEFPETLYQEWYRIYGLKKPERNRPFKFKHLTMDHVYKPLARSNGTLSDLVQINRAERGKKSDRLHQFLSEIGVKALRQHLGQLLAIAKLSKNQTQYERYFQELFDDQLTLDV